MSENPPITLSLTCAMQCTFDMLTFDEAHRVLEAQVSLMKELQTAREAEEPQVVLGVVHDFVSPDKPDPEEG